MNLKGFLWVSLVVLRLEKLLSAKPFAGKFSMILTWI